MFVFYTLLVANIDKIMRLQTEVKMKSDPALVKIEVC